MKFAGQGRKLDDIDLPRIGAQIGVGEDELHAVLEVETRGGGFFKDGRLKMLPERHVFYRELGPGVKRDKAVRLGLAYKRWGTKPYPKSVNARYEMLVKMMEIDRDAALRSCSWALGQIMGFNHALAGYASAEAMVEGFVDDEETHLEAMVSFIKNTGLADELRRHDWRGFARGYNGSGYEKHGYHTKLKRAFQKWQKIPDTPFDIDRREPEPTDVVAVKRKERAAAGGLVAALVGVLYAFGERVTNIVCSTPILELICGGAGL